MYGSLFCFPQSSLWLVSTPGVCNICDCVGLAPWPTWANMATVNRIRYRLCYRRLSVESVFHCNVSSFVRVPLLVASLISSSNASSLLFRYTSTRLCRSPFTFFRSRVFLSHPLLLLLGFRAADWFSRKPLNFLTESSVLKNPGYTLAPVEYLQSHSLALWFTSHSLKTRIQLGNLSLYYSASMYCAVSSFTKRFCHIIENLLRYVRNFLSLTLSVIMTSCI